MHAISSYRGNRPTHKHTHPVSQTGPITIHCAAAAQLARSVKIRFISRAETIFAAVFEI